MGDTHVGLQARLMSQALRKLAGTLNRTDTICIFTNQLREKIGVMFGNPETTPGGRALKFYSSVRLDIRRIETLKDGAEAFGNRVRVKVVKNKVAPPFKQAEFDIIYGSGISWEGTVLDVALEKKIVQKAGSYFSFGDERLGQGRQNATAFLRENPDIVQQILARHPGGGAGRAGRSRPGCCRAAAPQERGASEVGGGRARSRRPRPSSQTRRRRVVTEPRERAAATRCEPSRYRALRRAGPATRARARRAARRDAGVRRELDARGRALATLSPDGARRRRAVRQRRAPRARQSRCGRRA